MSVVSGADLKLEPLVEEQWMVDTALGVGRICSVGKHMTGESCTPLKVKQLERCGKTLCYQKSL